MLSVLEARVNVCVEASRSVGSNFLFAGLTLKENPRSLAGKDSEAVLGVWCPASQPPWRSPLGWGALWPLA